MYEENFTFYIEEINLEFNGITINENIINRFLCKIIKREDGCWELNCAHDKDGYSRFGIYSKNIGPKNIGGHRFMYMLHHKDEDITKLEICHHCDQPFCVNPDHLFSGTHQDNVADCVSKNRQSKGNKLPQSVLTEEIVKDILDGIINKKYTSINQIAKKFLVLRATIGCLLNEKTWVNVTKNYDMINIRNIIINPTTKSNKLSVDDVIDIRKRLKNGERQSSIAKLYKIDNKTIYCIKNNTIHKQ